MQCINSISSFINSSSTTGCNASTALAHTLIPAAQLDNAIKALTSTSFLASQPGGYWFQQQNWMQCIKNISYNIISSSVTGAFAWLISSSTTGSYTNNSVSSILNSSSTTGGYASNSIS
jgi:hypothetical protein